MRVEAIFSPARDAFEQRNGVNTERLCDVEEFDHIKPALSGA